jgi:Domain of unknown function (DUF4166)
VREYELRGRTRRFDATMIRADDGHVVDYLGTQQHLAVDLDLRAEEAGSLLLRSTSQRFYERFVGFPFPLVLSGRATLRERYDDAAEVFRIDLVVEYSAFGFLFGYDGEFTCTFPLADDAPVGLKPVRDERRK